MRPDAIHYTPVSGLAVATWQGIQRGDAPWQGKAEGRCFVLENRQVFVGQSIPCAVAPLRRCCCLQTGGGSGPCFGLLLLIWGMSDSANMWEGLQFFVFAAMCLALVLMVRKKLK